MAQQTIQLGTVANDRTGDPLRTALDKCNDNFDELYSPSRNWVCGSLQTGTPVVVIDATNGLPTYGAELLTTSGWTVGSGWTESPDDTFAHTSGTATLTHSAVITNTTPYQLTYTIAGRTTGSISVSFGGQSKTVITASGSFGPTAASTAGLVITPTTDFNGTCVFSLKAITQISNPLLTLKNSSDASIVEIRGSTTNCYIGLTSGRYNTTGINNAANGYQALRSNTTGSYNTANGISALQLNTDGSYNTANGGSALQNNTTGTYNAANGISALQENTTGSHNTATGVSALYYNTIGQYNTASGRSSLRSNTVGSNNTALGSDAGRYQADGATSLTDPENSIYIGYGARGKDNNDDNSIVIGYNAIGLGANTAVFGNNSTTLTRLFGNIATGTDTPSAAIHAIKTTEQLRLGYDGSNYASFTVSSAGVLTLTTSANKIALGTASRTPASATAAGTAGEVCWDANYVYVCVAANTWRRAALSSW